MPPRLLALQRSTPTHTQAAQTPGKSNARLRSLPDELMLKKFQARKLRSKAPEAIPGPKFESTQLRLPKRPPSSAARHATNVIPEAPAVPEILVTTWR